ncbi:MAG TPA: GNAT family N-acetyltransferase [Vicinamibacterales bacterium]|nr:GNAT family N-acetyltransferase [Vicinamibacterales bacterium]
MSQLVAALDSSHVFAPMTQPLPAPGLEVELRRDLDVHPDDEAAIEALVAARPEVGVFVSKPWLSGFFADCPPGTEQALLLFRKDGRLRAIVPVAVSVTMTHVRVRLLGGALGSDRVDLLAARGFEATAAETFLAWLRGTFGGRGFVLELRDVCGTSPLWGAIHRSGMERTQRLTLQPREIYPAPYLSLNGGEAENAADSPSSAALRSMQKHRRWLERRCRVRIDLLAEHGAVLEAFECLARFLGARWRGHGGSVLDNHGALRFHRHVLPLLLDAGRLRMMRISADARTVAVFYGLAAGRWWGYYLAGYDREWAGRIHLGLVNLSAAIDLAAREGAAEFDFLKGAERVKYTWPVRERTTLDADVFSENVSVQLTRATRATRDATAALTKSARALFS